MLKRKFSDKDIKLIILLITFFTLIISSICSEIYNFDFTQDTKDNLDNGVLKSSTFWTLNPIHIDNNWTETNNTNTWCNGKGTFTEPYVIENVTIDGKNSDYCLLIENTDEFFIIRNCTFDNTSKSIGSGIYLNYVHNGTLFNNTCSQNNRIGIRLNKSNNNTIFNNSLCSMRTGIYTRESDYVNFTKNDIRGNSFTGIQIVLSDFNEISENTVIDNRENGILLTYATSCDVTNNIVNNSDIGIQLSMGSDHEIIGNNMTNCGIVNSNSINNVIDTTNLVNKKPVYYYFDQSNLGSGDFTNAGQVILDSCVDSVVSNLNLSYGSIGVYLEDCGNITVSDNEFSNNTLHGIYYISSDNVSAYLNNMTQCGLHAWGDIYELTSCNITTTNLVNDKKLFYYINETYLDSANFTTPGQIILVNCNNSIVNNLNLCNQSLGVSLHFGHNNTISCNYVSHNSADGVYLRESTNNTVFNNTANNNGESGILIWDDSNFNNISYNRANANYYDGIDIDHSSNNTVIGNNASLNDEYGGIILWSSENCTISLNNASFNVNTGIRLSGECFNATITNNYLENNGDYGFWAYSTNNTIFTSNEVNNNSEHGIFIKNGYFMNFRGNTINNNTLDGIRLESIESSTFNENDFSKNFNYGVEITDSTSQYNLFFNNSFLDNYFNTIDSGTNNDWNNTELGNIWSNYTGVDLNDDGIGDSPYNYNGVVDYLPIFSDGDSIPPAITIISPLDGSYSNSIPVINVSTSAPDLNRIWYSNGTFEVTLVNNVPQNLNSSIWDDLPDEGLFYLYVSARDNVPNMNTVTLTLYKDVIAPRITISSPNMYDQFQNTPPEININVSDTYLNSIWFTLENESGIILSDTWEGIITQEQWDSIEDGLITIKFYANDFAGNEAVKSVTVRKNTAAILIEGDTTWSYLKAQGLCKGTGTYADPYIIEDIFLDGNNDGSCFEIKNSDVYFILSNCTFTNSGSGPYDAGFSMINVSNGQLVNNNCSFNNGNGMFLSDCSNMTISNNHISNNGLMGIFLKDSYENLLSENTANNNGLYGIYIDPSDNNRITGNIANNNDYGIFLNSSDTNVILENIASFNEHHGIYLENCDYSIISENTAINNSEAGIHLSSSSDNTLSRNNVDYNSKYGIYFLNSHNNLLSGNLVDNNPIGIYLSESNTNTVRDNSLVDNQEGIVERNCVGNIFSNNQDNSPVPIASILIWAVTVPIMAIVSGGAIIVKRKTIYQLIKPKDKLKKPKLKKKLPFEYKEKLLSEEAGLPARAELPVEAELSTKKPLVSKPKAIEVAKPKKIKKLEKAIPSEYIITPAEAAETRKVEAEVDVEEQKIMCVVHRGVIDGNIYTCPKCKSFYCIRCAYVLIDRGENCWVCNEKFMLKKPEIQMYDEALMSKVEVEGPRVIFLSYSTLDSEYFNIPLIAERLEEFPEIDKVLFWEVDSGESVVDFMEETLRVSNIFMLFCTENSFNSEAVKGEWQAAYQLRKRGKMKIIPVFEKEENVPFLLLPLISVKFLKENFDAFIEDLYKETLR